MMGIIRTAMASLSFHAHGSPIILSPQPLNNRGNRVDMFDAGKDNTGESSSTLLPSIDASTVMAYLSSAKLNKKSIAEQQYPEHIAHILRVI